MPGESRSSCRGESAPRSPFGASSCSFVTVVKLSRAHHGVPARRVQPKTAAAIRDIPLVAQLSALLRDQRQTARFAHCGDYVFATGNGTPLGHRNVESRALQRAAAAAGLKAVRLHDLRHTFASHLIIDLGLDVAQVSRILGHASVTT
jgi:integrase